MSIEQKPDDRHKSENLTGSSDGGTDMPPGSGSGEDDGSAPIDGDDDHLKDDQKPITR
jgi:hypothetical protein